MINIGGNPTVQEGDDNPAPTMLSVAIEAFEDHSIYTPPYIVERVMSSVGCHLANIANMSALEANMTCMMKHGRPENLRQHVCLIIPSGFGKSTILRTIFHPETGLCSSVLTTAVRSTFSKESWLGSQARESGNVVTMDGIFQRYKQGIVAADEYARLLVLLNGDGISNDEVYLLTALDTDSVSKDLCTGSIDVTGVATTIIPGLRIPHMPLTMMSGLSRRFTFELYLPTIADARAIKSLNRNKATPKVKMGEYREIMGRMIDNFLSQYMTGFPPTLYYSEIDTWCDSVDIPHFEEDIFRRLAVGYSVVAGTFPNIHLTDQLRYMFHNEIESRNMLKSNIMGEIVKRVVSEGEVTRVNTNQFRAYPYDKVSTFLRQYYQMSGIEIRSAIAQARALGVRMDVAGGIKYLGVPV